MDQLETLISTLDVHTRHLPVIKDISAKANVPAGQVSLGLIAVLTVFMLMGIGADLITDLIGMFFPMYMSFKALETEGGSDDKLWLTYWVVFAVWKVLEEWCSFLFSWVPFYYVVKLALLIYLFAPQTKGATLIYDRAIRPFMLAHQQKIDASMTKLGDVAAAATEIAKEEAIKKGTEYMMASNRN